jgi:hypothetical protein
MDLVHSVKAFGECKSGKESLKSLYASRLLNFRFVRGLITAASHTNLTYKRSVFNAK